MFFNKTALTAVIILFTSTGCVSLNSEVQQAQINTLNAELAQEQETNQKTQTELAQKDAALQASNARIKELDVLVAEAAKVKVTELEMQSKIECKSTAKATAKAKAKAKTAAVSSKKNKSKIEDKTVLGESEWVYVSAVKNNYKGRIDTGATTSSINALDIEPFERDGEKWVRFILDDDEGKEKKLLEAKIERFVKILQSTTTEENKERRFVIKLHVRIGDIEQQTEFTLTDRQHMEYPILIGRTFLQDMVIVDVSKEYIYPQYHAKTE